MNAEQPKREWAYLVGDGYFCRECAVRHFGRCRKHKKPKLDCCAQRGASSYAAGQAVSARHKGDPPGFLICDNCGRLVHGKWVDRGPIAPDDPLLTMPLRVTGVLRWGASGGILAHDTAGEPAREPAEPRGQQSEE